MVELLEKEVPLITYNWPVQKIDYSHEDRIVRISNELGSVLLAKRVVITVPVTVRKRISLLLFIYLYLMMDILDVQNIAVYTPTANLENGCHEHSRDGWSSKTIVDF